jgi:hypothetical protein
MFSVHDVYVLQHNGHPHDVCRDALSFGVLSFFLPSFLPSVTLRFLSLMMAEVRKNGRIYRSRWKVACAFACFDFTYTHFFDAFVLINPDLSGNSQPVTETKSCKIVNVPSLVNDGDACQIQRFMATSLDSFSRPYA